MIPYIVQTTCASKKEAKNIAKILISKKLAACIQRTKIKSFYMWEGEFCKDKEYLLTIKTKKENYKAIEREIKENHSYDLPEIIGNEITNISREYKKFIKGSTK